MDWADDAFDVGATILEEVNSNISPLHMAVYAAQDAKQLKDALRTKRQIDSQNRAIENMNAATDAKEKAKYIRHLLRGKGQKSQGVGGVVKKSSRQAPMVGVAARAAEARQGVAG